MTLKRHFSERLKAWQRPIFFNNTSTKESFSSRTIKNSNAIRRKFLPKFPNQSNQNPDDAPLLLSNISSIQLDKHELQRRYSNFFEDPFNSNGVTSKTVPSYMECFFEENFGDLCKYLNLDRSIIDYNLFCLKKIIDAFVYHYRTYLRQFENTHGLIFKFNAKNLFTIPELTLALEFFLSMDVDLFFMKSCRYRGATSRCSKKMSFFEIDEPKPTYPMLPCEQVFCSICSQNNNQSIDRQSSANMVKFSELAHQHRFLNGYEVYLNCPATCTTTNIIFSLTCVCQQYDFVGSTSLDLNEIIKYHRKHTLRMLIDLLLFGHFQHICSNNVDHYDRLQANNMRIYHHIIRCPAALQEFLRYNSEYWCFIPVPIDTGLLQDLDFLSSEVNSERNSWNFKLNLFDCVRNSNKSSNVQQNELDIYLRNVPQPPDGFTFTRQQRKDQSFFFQKYLNTKQYHHRQCDLYETSIVAVLPINASDIFRCFIENLFATHTESKLNMMNLTSSDLNEVYGIPNQLNSIWCKGLIHPITTITTMDSL